MKKGDQELGYAPMKKRQERPPLHVKGRDQYPIVEGDLYEEALRNGTPWDEQKCIEELVKCKRSVLYFLKNYCMVRHPSDGTIPFIPFEYQSHKVLPAMMTVKQFVTRKFRQGGFTTLAALYCLWMLMFEVDREILVISKTDREAKNLLKMVTYAFDLLPEFMRCRYLTRNAHIFHVESGSRLQCYTPNAGASFSASVLIIDEAGKIDKMDERWADIYPVISAGENCRCWVISTCNGVIGKGQWYYECWRDAVAGINGFVAVDVSHTEHPRYCKPEFLEKQRKALGEHRFRQEVLRQFIAAGNAVFGENVVDELESLSRSTPPKRVLPCPLLPKDSPHKNLMIWEDPIKGMDYIIGVDVAEGLGANDPQGQKQDECDYSTIHVIRADTMDQVAEYRNDAVGPNDLAKVVNVIGRYYNEAQVVCESSAIGQAMLDTLYQTYQYDQIYSSNPKRKLGLTVSSANRSKIYIGAVDIIQKKLAKINSYRTASELRTIVYNAKLGRIDHMKGYHDDLFTALAYAYYCREKIVMNLPPGASGEYKPVYEYEESEINAMMKALQDKLGRHSGNDEDEDEGEEALLPGTAADTSFTTSKNKASEDRRDMAMQGATTSSNATHNSTADEMDDWGSS